MSNISFQGNPQQLAAGATAVGAAIVAAPVTALCVGAAAVAVGIGVLIHKNKKK